MSPEDLIKFIESSVPDHGDYLYPNESDEWRITNEWLCGTFAGRGFSGATKEIAAQKLINYFNKHIGHKSIVGHCVTESGWPNLESVKEWLKDD